MEDPPSSTGAQPGGVPQPPARPPSPVSSHQTPRSAAEDRLSESLALDASIGDPTGPSARPSVPGGPARHAVRGDVSTSSDAISTPGGPDRAGATSRFAVLRRRGGPGKPRRKAPWWELPLLVAIAIVVAMLIKTFLVQPYYIPSESMENTLYGCAGCSGDRILVNKPIYDIRDPHPGDIVVFKAPAGWDNEPTPQPPSNPILKGIRWAGQVIGVVPPDENDLVKRVIATGGQTVRCCDTSGNIQVSDSGPDGPWRSLSEPYVYQNLAWDPGSAPGAPTAGSTATGNDTRNFGPVTVPKGRLWVMGEHRSVSEDSRWHYAHDYRGDPVNSTVPTSAVIGKAVLIVWPPSRWRTLGTPTTFKTAAIAIGGPFAPPLASFGVVLPIWVVRRKRRRRR